jgi:hypothetical protein
MHRGWHGSMGWEDIVQQVYATTGSGAMCGCKERRDDVREEIRR